MSTLYFHIGMPKTGSTSIQAYFDDNRERVRETGLAYASLPTANHNPFVESQFRQPRAKIDASLIARNHRQYVENREEILKSFLAEMESVAAEGSDALVSAEMGSSFTAEELVEMRETVGMFDRMVSLAFVRPPRAWVRSSCQQSLQLGMTMRDFLTRPRRPRYRRFFGPHDEVLGKDLRLVMFHPSTMKDGCILQTLLSMMDRDFSALAADRAPRANESISLTAAKILSIVNAAYQQKAIPAGLPKAVDAPLRSGHLGRCFAEAFAKAAPGGRLPSAAARVLTSIKGPGFALPVEVEEAAMQMATGDLRWMSKRLGVDITTYDTNSAAPIDMASFETLSEDEAEAIATALERINEADGRPGRLKAMEHGEVVESARGR
ncbi:hypothetical protein L1787_21380 [Acuticoccus sp. M5D2P5]|uniref:hypothetical protein n=1 Tax=Acuticoccus kalidii TaxID=2910977 RepID=UPI001F31FB07|nr:hypothetical protein [Acuticoccus kalidii]MCF3935945.1 hypothetical protein [Acuticoccus kalidii]